MKFNSEDLVIESYPMPEGSMVTGLIPNGIKVTHKETGISVICEDHHSQHLNRKEALRKLAVELMQRGLNE